MEFRTGRKIQIERIEETELLASGALELFWTASTVAEIDIGAEAIALSRNL